MKSGVQSIQRAFQILRAIHNRQNGIGVGEIATETGLHISTASRIVSTLQQLGAVERVGGKLFIGDEIVTLANQAPLTDQLVSITTPYLRDLSMVTKEAVGLTVIENHECHVFFQIPSMHHVQIRDWTGERFLPHSTSTGKLYLASLDEAALARLLSKPLAKVASQTVIDSAELRQQLAKIRVEGVAWTFDELEDGLASVAGPIYNKHGGFVAGLYVSIPTYRLGDKRILAHQVRTTAEDISKHLGYESR